MIVVVVVVVDKPVAAVMAVVGKLTAVAGKQAVGNRSRVVMVHYNYSSKRAELAEGSEVAGSEATKKQEKTNFSQRTQRTIG